MYFSIRGRLAGVVLVVGAALLSTHLLAAGAHLRREGQANAGHQHVTNLDETTKADKKSLRLLADVIEGNF